MKTVDRAGYSKVDMHGSAWTTRDPNNQPHPTIWGDRGRPIENCVGVWVPGNATSIEGATFVPRLKGERYWSPDLDMPSFVRRVADLHGTNEPWRLSYTDLP